MMRVLNLTMQEAERYKVISEVEGGYLKVGEAAEILGLSERQVYRIKARVEKEGAGGVIVMYQQIVEPKISTHRRA
jgi:predicted transcriptional regulator of viral defense system